MEILFFSDNLILFNGWEKTFLVPGTEVASTLYLAGFQKGSLEERPKGTKNSFISGTE